MDVEQDDQTEVANREPEAPVFQYKPSERLEEMEKNLSNHAKAFVNNGKVNLAMNAMYAKAMSTDVAIHGIDGVQHEWDLMLEGPEASRVIDSFGQNFHKVLTSVDGGNMINMLASTVHVLLSKAGESKMNSRLNEIMSLTYSMFTSLEMPTIINKASGLVITAANKPKALLFVKMYWEEMTKLMNVKNINLKLNKYFSNMISMMQSMKVIEDGDQRMRRTRSNA